MEAILELLAMTSRVPRVAGSNARLVEAAWPADSAGARAIVQEAMRTDTDLPRHVTFGGGLTELASAYLMEPAIAGRLTAVWIGGPEHSELWSPPITGGARNQIAA
jgi:purine nucleosidase